MQAKIVSSAFSANPFEARAIVEFVPETQAEHDSLAALFGDTMGIVCINRSVNQILRAEFQLFKPSVLPPTAPKELAIPAITGIAGGTIGVSGKQEESTAT